MMASVMIPSKDDISNQPHHNPLDFHNPQDFPALNLSAEADDGLSDDT